MPVYHLQTFLVNNSQQINLQMDEQDDLDTYNGDTVHDMWVDFDYYENTGNSDVFDEDNLDDYVDNLDDWD